MVNSRLRRYVLWAAFALIIAFLLWPKPCVQYGGMMLGGSPSWECRCAGFLVTMRNDAPTDGLTIKRCVGVATDHRCEKPDGKPHIGEVLLVPCDTPSN